MVFVFVHMFVHVGVWRVPRCTCLAHIPKQQLVGHPPTSQPHQGHIWQLYPSFIRKDFQKTRHVNAKAWLGYVYIIMYNPWPFHTCYCRSLLKSQQVDPSMQHYAVWVGKSTRLAVSEAIGTVSSLHEGQLGWLDGGHLRSFLSASPPGLSLWVISFKTKTHGLKLYFVSCFHGLYDLAVEWGVWVWRDQLYAKEDLERKMEQMIVESAKRQAQI